MDSSFNIIEFTALGTKTKNIKRFYVVNPTSLGYEYVWKRIDEQKIPQGCSIQYEAFFKCMTQRGTILSGKKSEIIFEYLPESVGAHESYWTFEIPEKSIVQKFLIVGSV